MSSDGRDDRPSDRLGAAASPHDTAPQVVSGASGGNWIGHREIAAIPGALKPSAYVARAYLHRQTQGHMPPWAMKAANGRWQFDAAYIRSDAAENRATIGVSEAARLLGVTRRAVQTWVDEGRLPSVADARAKGQNRRIPRTDILALAAARAAERSAPASPAAPPAPTPAASDSPQPSDVPPAVIARLKQDAAAAEQRLAADLDRQRRELEALRSQLAEERRQAERQLRALQQAERRARERESRLRDGYRERLDKAHADTREMDRLRALAERNAARTARAERQADVRVQRLHERLGAQLEDWRQRSAALIARQLRDARRAWQTAPPPPAPDPAAARRSAEAVVHQLHTARDTRQRQDSRERTDAEGLAQRVKAEMARQGWDRYDAAIRFNQLAERANISDDVRIAVMRDYFSKP